MPAPGATQLNGLTLTTNQGFTDNGPMNLVDGSKGDVGTLEHLVAHSLGGNSSYASVSRIATLPAFTMTDGGSTTVNGAFVDVSANNTVAFTVLGTKFRIYQTAINPNAQATSPGPVSVVIVDQPGGLNFAGQSWNADLMWLYTDSDLTTPTIAYGTPLSGTWGAFMVAIINCTVQYTVSGATNPTTIYAHVSVADTISHLTASSIQPTVSPVTAAKINGNDLFTAQTGLGTTPTLTWQAPAVGTPTWYAVRIVSLTNKAGNTAQQAVATFITTQMSLQIPANVLTAGQSYVFRIDAGVGGNPYGSQETLPTASAQLLSAIQTM